MAGVVGSGAGRQTQGWGGVDAPENPGVRGESWSSSPAAGANPAPTSHTPLGP